MKRHPESGENPFPSPFDGHQSGIGKPILRMKEALIKSGFVEPKSRNLLIFYYYKSKAGIKSAFPEVMRRRMVRATAGAVSWGFASAC